MDEPSLVCCYCECDRRVHCFFIKCPLFMDEHICSDCCQQDIMKDEAENKLIAITRIERTRAEIDEICRVCAKRGL